jgi:hypothetical protein
MRNQCEQPSSNTATEQAAESARQVHPALQVARRPTLEEDMEWFNEVVFGGQHEPAM